MAWEIVLWIWVGIVIGSLVGSVLTYMVQKGKVLDLQDEVYDSRVVREALKDRHWWLKNASHAAKPIEIVIPRVDSISFEIIANLEAGGSP